MDKMKRLILFLILCPVLVLGQTSARRDSLRITSCNLVGLPTAGTAAVTTAMMNNAINYAIQQVSADFPAVEKLDTLILRDTVNGVALPSDLNEIRWCAFVRGDTVTPLEYVSEDSLFSKRNVSQPRFYYSHGGYLRTWARFRDDMFETDQDTLILLLAYYAIDSGLASDTATTAIGEPYRGALLDYICYQLEMMRYRYQTAAFYAARYDKAKAEASAGK